MCCGSNLVDSIEVLHSEEIVIFSMYLFPGHRMMIQVVLSLGLWQLDASHNQAYTKFFPFLKLEPKSY